VPNPADPQPSRYRHPRQAKLNAQYCLFLIPRLLRQASHILTAANTTASHGVQGCPMTQNLTLDLCSRPMGILEATMGQCIFYTSWLGVSTFLVSCAVIALISVIPAPIANRDLSAFSLSQQTTGSPSQGASSSSRYVRSRDPSIQSTASTSTSFSSTSRPSMHPSLLNRLEIGPGDDGLAVLPAQLPMDAFILTPHPRLPSLSTDSGGGTPLRPGMTGARSTNGYVGASPPLTLPPLRDIRR
jgi:hypothetical protein